MKRTFAAFAVVVALVALPGVAQADDADYAGPVTITFAKPNQVVEYGEQWTIAAVAAPTVTGICSDCSVYASMTGPASITPRAYSYLDESTFSSSLTVVAPSGAPPLEPGAYTLKLRLPNFTDEEFSEPFTVAPAELGVEVRLASDPAVATNAILSARFTGRFVDQFLPAGYPGAGLAPAGSWHLVITDAKGEPVFEKDIPRSEGGNDLAVTAYWTEAEPGAQYSATATFTPSGASTTRFEISDGNDYPFTASSIERPVPTSTATAPAPVARPESEETISSVALPLWLIAIVGLVIAGLAALLTITLLRNRRTRAATLPSALPVTEVEA